MKTPSTKMILAIAAIAVVLVAFGIAPIIEVTIKDKNNVILMHSVYREVMGSQSIIPMDVPGAASVDVKIIQKGAQQYYECEEYVPKTLAEVKEHCFFAGSTELPR